MTTRTAMILCAFALLTAITGKAQDLESYRKKYDDGLTKITADHQEQIEDITKAYSTGLTTIKARVQAAGNLDKLKSVMDEISRFQMAKALPTEEDKLIPEVLALLKACQANITKADIAKAQRIVSLASRYDKALLHLQQEHTRKGELDIATALQKERRALSETEPVSAARALLAPSTTTLEQPPPVPRNDTAVPSKKNSPFAQLEGVWNVKYKNGHWRSIRIDDAGSVEVLTASWNCKGLTFHLVEDKETQRLVSSRNDRGATETYHVEGSRFRVNRWGRGSSLEQRPDTSGVGIKEK